MSILFYFMYGNLAYFSLIPVVVFVPTVIYLCLKPVKIKCNHTVYNENQPTFYKKTLFCNGNINKMVTVDVISGWVLSIIFLFVEQLGFKSGYWEATLFVHYFLIQVYHFINLVTAHENTLKLKVCCIVFMIPEIYMCSLWICVILPFVFAS